MLEGKLIVCDSNIPWHHNRYSKHHLMAQLAKTNEVVFVDPEEDWRQYLRRPREQRGALGRRWWYPRGESLTVFTPLQLPGRARFDVLRRWDERYYVRQIRSVVRRYPGRDLILFLGNAWHVFLLDAFPEAACTIYHCSDNFPAMFTGGFREAFEKREAELIRRADLVICSHPTLVEKCQALGGNAHYLEHAVDERFFRPEDEVECPPDLAEIPRPRVGFVGSLDATIDFSLLEEVILRCPQSSFVLIGPADRAHHTQVDQVARLDNCWWLGPKPWCALPAYLWGFDAGLVPFATNRVTSCGCPLKVYEYLAAGLPTISTPLRFSARLRALVTVAGSSEEFAQAVSFAVRKSNAAQGRQVQVRIMRTEHTWGRRAEEFGGLVLENLRCW